MKRFILKILLFFTIVAIIDSALGTLFDKIVSASDVSEFGRDNHICNTGREDILVFGSSRAVHHYDSNMLTDSLGLSCYNCGEDGQGIILNYCRLLMFKQHHTPKVVIYDIEPQYDIYSCDNQRFLKWLKTHGNRPKVKEIISSVDNTEQYKLLCKMYQYNSELTSLAIAIKHFREQDTLAGFNPRRGVIDSYTKSVYSKHTNKTIDSLKIGYMKDFIQSLKDSKLFVIISPLWHGGNNEWYMPVYQLCQKFDVELIDFSNNPKYVHQDKYFLDATHLNDIGANEFTKDLIKIIKKRMTDGSIPNMCRKSSVHAS